MISGINFFYNLLGIRKDIFSIYYTFDDYSGVNIIPSVSGAQGLYSGSIQGAGFSLNNGSGYFNGNSWVKINSIENLTGKKFSHFFVFEKTGMQSGTLFSSLPTSTSNSGYEIGLTDYNKIYFKYNTGAPAYYTFDTILANRNAVAITLSDSYLEFDWFNFNTKRFESDSAIIRANLLFESNERTIGKGFKGTIDDYVYINGTVSKSNREKLFSGFFTLLDLQSGSQLFVTGYNSFQRGEISGSYKLYTTGYIFYTGNLNFSQSTIPILDSNQIQFFGNITDECNNVSSLYTYSGYTGKLFTDRILSLEGNLFTSSVSSGIFIEPSILSGITVTGYVESGIELFNGVTGVQVIENVSVIDHCGNVSVAYTYNELTGVISGTTLIPLTGMILSYDTNLVNYSIGQFRILEANVQSPYVIDNNRIIPFGYNSITYLWNKEDSETLELQTFPNTIEITNLDKGAGFDAVRGAAVLDAAYTSGIINLWTNGQLQQESGRYFVGNVYNQTLVKEADYYLENNFAYGNYELNDQHFYDYILSNDKKFKLVTGSTTNIGSAHARNFFINGQKIYTGSYILNGDDIILTGEFSNVTGMLIHVAKYANEQSITGTKSYNFVNRFPKYSSCIYQNGIKYSDFGFVEHSDLDRISGSNIFNINGNLIYDKIESYWE